MGVLIVLTAPHFARGLPLLPRDLMRRGKILQWFRGHVRSRDREVANPCAVELMKRSSMRIHTKWYSWVVGDRGAYM